MSRIIDLTGMIFGRFTVVKQYGKDKRHNIIWECLCNCGNTSNITTTNLKNGHIKSCGCLRKESTSKTGSSKRTHGYSRTPTYNTWSHMNQRCNNKDNFQYKDYGGRGITVCDRWDINKGGSFENFLKDMGEKPKGKSLDRIDNRQLIEGYSPENCRWSTPKEQNRNKRNNKLYTYNSKTLCEQDWLEEIGLNCANRKRL
jgi:hypothetical protein